MPTLVPIADRLLFNQ